MSGNEMLAVVKSICSCIKSFRALMQVAWKDNITVSGE